MLNIRIDYEYRDARGAKACRSVVLRNPDNLMLSEIRTRLEAALWEKEFFIADQIRLSEAFLFLEGPSVDELDHCFHHLDAVEVASQEATDTYKRSVDNFLREVELQAALGWRLFDPAKR